ncbi:MAG: DMT family transporter [Rhodospirillales bacterium]|nr:DMT family transporter [Rhodospirillales bacterium]
MADSKPEGAAGVAWPFFLLTLSQMLFASNAILGRMVEGVVPPIGLSFWRWVVATALIFPFAYKPMRAHWPVIKAFWKGYVSLAFFLIVLGNTMIYVALNFTTAINTAIVAVAQPAVTFVLSWLIARERVGRAQIVGVAIAAIGVVTVISRGDPNVILNLSLNPGDLWMLVSVFGFAVYAVMLPRAPVQVPNIVVLNLMQILGIILLLPLYAWETAYVRPVVFNMETVLAVIWVATMIAVVALWLWNYGVNAVGANVSSAFIYVRTIAIAAMAILILGESLKSYHMIAIALVFVGIWLVTRYRQSRAGS